MFAAISGPLPSTRDANPPRMRAGATSEWHLATPPPSPPSPLPGFDGLQIIDNMQERDDNMIVESLLLSPVASFRRLDGTQTPRLTIKFQPPRQAPLPLAIVTGSVVTIHIPLDPSFGQISAILRHSQVWRPIAQPSRSALGISFEARAIRPSTGGLNGLVLKDQRAIQSIVFPRCCSDMRSFTRHVLTVSSHYARLREHALEQLGFQFYECAKCGINNTRWDKFQRSHRRNGCDARSDGASEFVLSLCSPVTYHKSRTHILRKREKFIDESLAYLSRTLIDDDAVSRLMMEWDVIPDRIGQFLNAHGYQCYSESDVWARDMAADVAV